MRTLALLVLPLALATWGWAGELGTNLSWDGEPAGYGWIFLSGRAFGVSLSARGELDLLPVRPRLLSLAAKLDGEWFSLSGGGKLLGTGRLDLSGDAKLLWQGRWEEISAFAEAGARAVGAAVTAGAPPSYALHGKFRLDREPLWTEAQLEYPLSTGGPRTRLSLGISGASWAKASLTLAGTEVSGVGLELGSSREGASGTAYFGVFPRASATGSLRMGNPDRAVQLRVSVGPGRWRLSLSVSSGLGPLAAKGSVSLSRWEGLEKVTLEVRWPL